LIDFILTRRSHDWACVSLSCREVGYLRTRSTDRGAV